MFPVIRIAAEKQIRTGFVLRNHVWSENSHLLLRRLCRHDGHLIEEAIKSCDWRRKGDADAVLANDLRLDLAVARAKRVAGRRMQSWIHELLHRVGYIFCGKGRSIGE